jgi:Zn-dependent alcohol dehydrogenase
LPKLPAILGREIAGRVEDVGEGVSSVKVFEIQLVLLEVY